MNQSVSKSLVVIVAIMVTCYLTANVMAVKLISVRGITVFDAGTLIFPITYMLGDVLTELWGFRTAKRVIWLTFLCEVVFTLFVWIGVLLPYPNVTATTAEAYATVFSFVPRITVASLLAFLVGELTNAWFMARIKRLTHGKWLWVRTIGSTIPGCLLDTAIFVCVAFGGVVPNRDLASMIAIQVMAKILIEVCASTPMAYGLIALLKRKVQQHEG